MMNGLRMFLDVSLISHLVHQSASLFICLGKRIIVPVVIISCTIFSMNNATIATTAFDQLKHTLSVSSTPLCHQWKPLVTTLISSLNTPQDFERLCQEVTNAVQDAYNTCVLQRCHCASVPESAHEHTLQDTLAYMQAMCNEYTKTCPPWTDRIQTILRPLEMLWYKQHPAARARGQSPPWYTPPLTSVHWVSYTSTLEWNEVARAYLESRAKVLMTNDSEVHFSETQWKRWTIVPRWIEIGIDDRLSRECAALTRRCYLMTPPNTMFQLRCDSLKEMVRWLHRAIYVEQTYQRVLPSSTSSTTSATSVPGWSPTMLRQMMEWWCCSEADRELDRTMESFPMTNNTPPPTGHTVGPKGAWYWPELRYAFHHRDDTVVRLYFRKWIVQWESYGDCEYHRWLMHASTPPPNRLDSDDYPFSLSHRMNIFRCYLRDVIRQTQWTPDSLCELYSFVRNVVEPVLDKETAREDDEKEPDDEEDEQDEQDTVTLSQIYRFIGHEVYNELYLNDPESTESAFCGWLYDIVKGYPDPARSDRVIAANARVRWNIWYTIASQFIQPEALLQWYIDDQLKPTALNGWAYKTEHEQKTFHAMRKAYQTACAPLMPGATHASLWTLVDDIVEQMDVVSASVSPEARGCSSRLRKVHRAMFAMHSVRWPYPNKTTTTPSHLIQPLQPLQPLHPSWKALVDHSATPYQQNHPSNLLTIHPRASWVQATLTIDIKTPTTTYSSSSSSSTTSTSPTRQIIPRIVPTHSQLFATYTVSSTEGDDTCCSICSEPFNQACKNPQCMQCQSDFQEGCRLQCNTEYHADQLQSYKDSLPVVQEGRCGHRYHGCCIATWLQRQRWEDADPTCPMCRQPWVYNTNENQTTVPPLCCQDCQETPDDEDDEDVDMDDDRRWLTCSDLSDDTSNNESGDSGESSSEDEDYEDDDTALDDTDTHHYTCTIRGPLHLMNLLTWMTGNAEVTTVVQLSEQIDGSSIPSAGLRADVIHLCTVIPWLTYSEGTGLWFVEWTMNDAVEEWKAQQEKQTKKHPKDHPKESDIVLGELCL